ncbi:DUF6113 family protein [Streptosporangium saharense]|uniref:Protein-S-isoprenylcysteine O-methyltransferase Ste14 n=1 Tax=Streptosporangium saharense TaxID=1706840 RepID=A0A7W7QQP9_9ACTN|nr:DUF6113 family protein [Streptosporangium saharense]MBB4917987.1 protein-S-isoprenylcysteine O-methyltransferase Ste14 [Streptosporangium saharense]
MVVMEQVPTAERSSGRAVAVAAYAVLFVLGLVMGLLGAFQHSWYLRPTTVPVSAFGCVLALFAVCYGAGRMMGGKLAALAAASGWLVMTMVWLSGRQEGDVIIAADLSGYIYLYGGMVAALTAVLVTPTSHGGSWLLTRH